jgi:uncharacterized protein
MPNRLSQSTSPYLRQHADNPVDWYMWGPEALDKAKAEQKPILLSIGYSACHWCHVMAHESFEDAVTAHQMNEQFINIKVDREERPDIDHIYQAAHHLLTGRGGGWPLTMILTPDQEPFFAGTYFPAEPRYRMPAFKDLLNKIHETWTHRRDAIYEQNARLLEALKEESAAPIPGQLPTWQPEQDANLPSLARMHLLRNHDPVHGGFGGAPKFPHPTDLELLFTGFQLNGDARYYEAFALSMCSMANRGMFDQLGGGFYRYCVDAEWAIPHFEKMLYDNGPLLHLCADLWSVSHSPRLREVAEWTVDWLFREMQSPEGPFFSALDADSEGEEGLFYLWDRDTVRAHIPTENWNEVSLCFGLDQDPNFEGHAWHLHWHATSEHPTSEVLYSARRTLFDLRKPRVRPGLDDKILASWNGLMITGLAFAGRIFEREDWINQALSSLKRIQQLMMIDGKLHAVFAGGRAQLNAYLDDHAFLLQACIECLQVRWDPSILIFAEQLAHSILNDFEDPESGGYFFTRHDHEPLLTRPRIVHDAATPSGYAVATRMLIILGHLTGQMRFIDSAEKALNSAIPQTRARPSAFASLMLALEIASTPPQIIVLRGTQSHMRIWEKAISKLNLPHSLCFAVPQDAHAVPIVFDKPLPKNGEVNAWVCRGLNCLPEITDLSTLLGVCKSQDTVR